MDYKRVCHRISYNDIEIVLDVAIDLLNGRYLKKKVVLLKSSHSHFIKKEWEVEKGMRFLFQSKNRFCQTTMEAQECFITRFLGLSLLICLQYIITIEKDIKMKIMKKEKIRVWNDNCFGFLLFDLPLYSNYLFSIFLLFVLLYPFLLLQNICFHG